MAEYKGKLLKGLFSLASNIVLNDGTNVESKISSMLNPLHLYKSQESGASICNKDGFYILIAYSTSSPSNYYVGIVYKANSTTPPVITPLASSGITTGASNAGGTIVVNNATNVLSYFFE